MNVQKRLRRSVLVMLVAVLLIPAIALKPSGQSLFTWQQGAIQRDSIIEAQTVDYANPIVNPTQAFWDIDDSTQFSGTGDIEALGEVSYQLPLIADSSFHLWGLQARLPKSAQVDVAIQFGTGQKVAITKVTDAGRNGYVMTGCAMGSVYTYYWVDGRYYSPDLVYIDGSNGGMGQAMSVTFRIRNLATQTVRYVGAYGHLGPGTTSAVQQWCPGAQSTQDLLFEGYPQIGRVP